MTWLIIIAFAVMPEIIGYTIAAIFEIYFDDLVESNDQDYDRW